MRTLMTAMTAMTAMTFMLAGSACLVEQDGGSADPLDDGAEPVGAVEQPTYAHGDSVQCPNFEGDDEVGDSGGCGAVVDSAAKPSASQPSTSLPVASTGGKKGMPKPGGGNRCPLPAGSTVVRGGSNYAEQVQCYVNTENECSAIGAYLYASNWFTGQGNSSGPGNIANSCQGMTGDQLVGCLIDSAKSELSGSPGAVCRDYAYLVDRACAEMGLSCDFQAGPAHAWVVLHQNPGCDYVIDAFNNVAYCMP